ncbi:hypothetical protein AB1Y20_002501 [Prymnesium parvum]|uniref:Uncharacterized protein n=1 Tax=Prymnesium parvum TaxID=97485 RepID=A0AB34JB15_PRYPA
MACRFGQRRCAWLPHRACWQLEYKTALEMQRQAALNRTLNSLFHEARNRSTAASASRGNGSACAAALPLFDFLQMDMRKPLLTANSEREAGTGGGRGGGHARMGRGAAVGSRGRGGQGEKKPSLARLREALKSVTTAFSRSPTPQLQAALSSAASALFTATREHRSAPAEGRALQATPPHTRARKSLLAERRGETTRQAQLAAALRSLACEKAEVASLGDVAVGEFLRHRALRPSQLLTQGKEWSSLFPPAGASPRPSPASSEQVAAFLKSLPGYSSNPSSWLQRDAKCIDETFRHAAASG